MKRLCYFSLLFGVFFYSFFEASSKKILFKAIKNQNPGVKVFFDNGSKKLLNSRNKNKQTPLMVAIKSCPDIVTDLLKRSDIDVHAVDVNGCNALHFAAQYNCLSLIKPLLEKGLDINSVDFCGKTPLHHAASGGFYDVVTFLLYKGAGVNVQDDAGNTPLHGAVMSDDTTAIERLYTYGADSYIENKEGYSPIGLAAEKNKGVVPFLFKQCAASDLNGGDTYLHRAIELFTKIDDIKSIFDVYVKECGVDVDIQNLEGDSPLHFAVRMDKDNFAKILIEKYGADFDKENNESVSPRDIAQQYSQNTSPKLIDRKHRDSAEKLLKLFGKTSLISSEREKI